MNAQSHAGLWDETYCVARTLEQLALGRERFFGSGENVTSWFHYRAAALAALLASDLGSEQAVVPAPAEACAGLLMSARVQAVQCSPDEGNRRTPSRAMLKNCPDYVLWRMVECLEPRTIALLGAEARALVETRFRTKLVEVHRLVHVGEITVADRAVRVVAVRHPSSGFGMQSILATQRLMRADRLWLEAT